VKFEPVNKKSKNNLKFFIECPNKIKFLSNLIVKLSILLNNLFK